MLSIPKASGIYKITCTVTKKIYLGSSIDLRRRWNQHRSNLRSNTHDNSYLQRAWNKYGEESFIFEVLELVLPMSLPAREQFWLNKLKPFDNKGFNMNLDTESPRLGTKASPETLEKLRIAQKGKHGKGIPRAEHYGYKESLETRENMRLSHLGKKLSPESIEKRTQAQRGKKLSPEHREKLRQYHLGRKRSPESVEKSRLANIGRKASPETREKLRQNMLGDTRNLGKKHTPETCEKWSRIRLGHETSPETRKKIGDAHRGKIISEEARAKSRVSNAHRMKTLIVTSPDGTEYIVTGVNEFCREHNLNRSLLMRVAKGVYSQHHGWIARFPEAPSKAEIDPDPLDTL